MENGKLKNVGIVVNNEFKFFGGYYHIFWKRFAPKQRGFADNKLQTGEVTFLSRYFST